MTERAKIEVTVRYWLFDNLDKDGQNFGTCGNFSLGHQLIETKYFHFHLQIFLLCVAVVSFLHDNLHVWEICIRSHSLGKHREGPI